MIRPLRRAHGGLILLLALVLPLIVFAAVMMRADRPVQREWPFEVRP